MQSGHRLEYMITHRSRIAFLHHHADWDSSLEIQEESAESVALVR